MKRVKFVFTGVFLPDSEGGGQYVQPSPFGATSFGSLATARHFTPQEADQFIAWAKKHWSGLKARNCRGEIEALT